MEIPTYKARIKGKLEATEKHLADMRELVFMPKGYNPTADIKKENDNN